MDHQWQGGRRAGSRTEDPHEAAALIAEAYLPNRVDRLDSRPFELQLDALRLDSVTVGLVSFGSRTRVRTVEATHYHVNLPVRGDVVSRTPAGEAAATAPGQAAVFMPHLPADMVWGADCLQLCLMIPVRTLVEELEHLLGASVPRPPTFESRMDLSTPTGRGWRAALEVVSTELTAGPGLVARQRVAHQLERVLVDGLLMGQPHTYSAALDRGGHRPPSRAVALARDLLEDHPEEPWSGSSLAARVHVSLRSLQEGFASELGVPPMRYLHGVRLRKARDLLRESSPKQSSVTAVAAGLGLGHPGRFAADYRRTFGESPSETLRRD